MRPADSHTLSSPRAHAGHEPHAQIRWTRALSATDHPVTWEPTDADGARSFVSQGQGEWEQLDRQVSNVDVGVA